MITWLLRRLSVRHPLAVRVAQAAILFGGTACLLAIALWDLRTGRGRLRPLIALAALTLVAVCLAATGLKRRV